MTNWMQTIITRWRAFRTWQIGDCVEAAGRGNKQLGKAFFRGTIDSALPFFSGETMNTLLHLVFRPGYMIREFLRGKDNHILSPLTALIVFFAMQVVLASMLVIDDTAMIEEDQVYAQILQAMDSNEQLEDSTWNDRYAMRITGDVMNLYRLTHLDLLPDEELTPSQLFLAGVEGWLRGQGVFRFLWLILLVMCSMWIVGQYRYRLTFSASACISAYMLCQYCFYNTLMMLFSLGHYLTIPRWLVLILLYENIYQLLGVGHKRTFVYVLTLLLVMFALLVLAVTLFVCTIFFYAYGRV